MEIFQEEKGFFENLFFDAELIPDIALTVLLFLF
jgi:hypothetical protein